MIIDLAVCDQYCVQQLGLLKMQTPRNVVFITTGMYCPNQLVSGWRDQNIEIVEDGYKIHRRTVQTHIQEIQVRNVFLFAISTSITGRCVTGNSFPINDTKIPPSCPDSITPLQYIA